MDNISDLKVDELGDPDDGLELREEIKSRLERSLANKQAVKKNISAQKVAAKLGLEW